MLIRWRFYSYLFFLSIGMIWSHTREARGEQLASSHGNETEDESELKGNLYEGDMILTERQWALLRQESKTSLIVTTCTLPWKSLKIWCNAYLGYNNNGRPQTLVISEGCNRLSSVLHELGHTIGMFHEHNRPDRDNYIEILYNNLLSQRYAVHYIKVTQSFFSAQPDVGYDIESLMHYSLFSNAKMVNGSTQYTIRIKDRNNLEALKCLNHLRIGTKDEFSYRDKKRINLLYNCPNVNIEKPPCILPTTPPPLTTPSPTEAATPAPTTTTTTPAPPTIPPLDRRLRKGNVIYVTMIEESARKVVISAHGISCMGRLGCGPIRCLGYSCQQMGNRLRLVKVRGSKPDISIRSGDTVALRSIQHTSKFFECSNPTRCSLSSCGTDVNVNWASSSYVPSCSKHHIEIIGVKRKKGKILNTGHKIQFKFSSGRDTSYLSCNGKWCSLQQLGVCRNSRAIFVPVQDSSRRCPADTFKIIKLQEN